MHVGGAGKFRHALKTDRMHKPQNGSAEEGHRKDDTAAATVSAKCVPANDKDGDKNGDRNCFQKCMNQQRRQHEEARDMLLVSP